MRWLSYESFSVEYQQRHTSPPVYLDESMVLMISEVALRGFIPEKPDERWDSSDPRPRVRWYGDAGGTLFVVNSPRNTSFDMVSIETPLRVNDPLPVFLEVWTGLAAIGLFKLGPIVWLRSPDSHGQYSLSYTDKHGIPYDVVRASSCSEIDALSGFLHTYSPTLVYSNTSEEIPGAVWIVVRKLDDGTGSIVARYSNYSSVAEFARNASLGEPVIFEIRREDSPTNRKRFFAGNLV